MLETSTAQELWEEANRTHARTAAGGAGKQEGSGLDRRTANVTLNLGSLLTNLASQVGIGETWRKSCRPTRARSTILRSDQLKTAQNIAVAVKGLALLLSILTFAAFGAAIYLSRDGRWVTVLLSGIGLIAAGFAVIVSRHVAGGIVVGQLVTNDSVKPAGEAAWSIGTSLMTSIATTVIVVGVLFAVAGWLASPTGAARATRRCIAPALRDHAAYVYTGLAIIVCIYFLSAPTQGLRSFLTTLIIAGMAAFGIHELRKQTAEEFPDADLRRRLRPHHGQSRQRGQGRQHPEGSASRPRSCACRRCGRPTGEGRRQAEAPTATLPDQRRGRPPARLERLGRAARERHPHRRGVRRREARVLGGRRGLSG